MNLFVGMPEHHPSYMSVCIEFTAFKGQNNLRSFKRSELGRNRFLYSLCVIAYF